MRSPLATRRRAATAEREVGVLTRLLPRAPPAAPGAAGSPLAVHRGAATAEREVGVLTRLLPHASRARIHI